jgi:hypothetical protein
VPHGYTYDDLPIRTTYHTLHTSLASLAVITYGTRLAYKASLMPHDRTPRDNCLATNDTLRVSQDLFVSTRFHWQDKGLGPLTDKEVVKYLGLGFVKRSNLTNGRFGVTPDSAKGKCGFDSVIILNTCLFGCQPLGEAGAHIPYKGMCCLPTRTYFHGFQGVANVTCLITCDRELGIECECKYYMSYSGTYKITCHANGRFYIGKTTNWKVRLYSHLHSLQSGSHLCRDLQRDWNAYGHTKFTFTLDEPIDIPHAITRLRLQRKRQLTARERERILTADPTLIYNTCRFVSYSQDSERVWRRCRAVLSAFSDS